MSDRERAIDAVYESRPPVVEASEVIDAIENAGLLILSRERLVNILRHLSAKSKRTRELEKEAISNPDRWTYWRQRAAEMTSAWYDTKEKLKSTVRFMNEHNARRNRELDALHFVWCNGGCQGGVHRWTEGKPDESTVRQAVKNTHRLVTWFINSEIKAGRISLEEAHALRKSILEST